MPDVTLIVTIDNMNINWDDKASAEKATAVIEEIVARVEEEADDILIAHDYDDANVLVTKEEGEVE